MEPTLWADSSRSEAGRAAAQRQSWREAAELRDKQQESRARGAGQGAGEARAEDGEPGIHRGPQSPSEGVGLDLVTPAFISEGQFQGQIHQHDKCKILEQRGLYHLGLVGLP